MSAVFDAYSIYYDALYRDKDYAAEAAYVERLIDAHRPGSRTLVDLGCGTGAHAAVFATAGYDVLGIDASGTMLQRAAERRRGLAPDVAARLAFVQGDVRTAPTERRADVVTALFHVASYQTGNDDIAAMLRSASGLLVPGGLFVFDFWHGPAVLSQRPEDRTRTIAFPPYTIVREARPLCLPREDVVEVHYTVEVRDGGGAGVQRFAEVHRMRYFFEPELQLLLGQAGLRPLACHAWMTDAAPTPGDWAAVIVATHAA